MDEFAIEEELQRKGMTLAKVTLFYSLESRGNQEVLHMTYLRNMSALLAGTAIQKV